MKALLGSAALLCALVITPLHASSLSPDDAQLRYVGRFDRSDSSGPRATWSGSCVAVGVSGGSVNVRLKDGGRNLWQVVINGEPTAVLELEPGEATYSLAENLPAGEHLIELFKRTEASIGATQILGFELDDGASILPVPERTRWIEIIGDSISCGYGNEAADKDEKFTPQTENGWLAYGAVAARKLNADYVCIAWSGKKLWPNNSITDLYGQTAPPASRAEWSFDGPAPDVVVINLGTNDFSQANPDEAEWVAAYVAFIERVRTNYPDAAIYCAVGPMISQWPGDRKPRSTILGYLEKVIDQANKGGGPAVRLLDFGVQAQHHGIGAQWHPSVRTHRIMANKMVAAISSDLGWDAQP